MTAHALANNFSFEVGMTPGPNSSSGSVLNQRRYFPLILGTKDPAIPEWQKVAPGAFPAAGNYGIALENYDLFLDADPRNYPPGRDVMGEIMQAHMQGVVTRVVKTPSGGYHFYFKAPADHKVKKDQPKFPGVDFLSAGCFVVGPGSETIAGPKRSAGRYEVICDAPVADIPPTFLALLEREADRLVNGSEPTLLMAGKFEDECKHGAIVAIEGQGGDKTTYEFACRGRDYGLPAETVFQLMRDYWNPRCQPAWNEGDLWAKVEHAFKYARNAAGAHSPAAVFTPEMGRAHRSSEGTRQDGDSDQTSLNGFDDLFAHTSGTELSESGRGSAQNVLANRTGTVTNATEFQHQKVIDAINAPVLELDAKSQTPLNKQASVIYLLKHSSEWKGRFKYNIFADRYEMAGRAGIRYKTGQITNHDLSIIQAWFSCTPGVKLEVPINRIEAAIAAVATPYHPVEDYLNSLVWDGVKRLDTILPDTTGCDDNPYTRAAGVCMMVAAVKRIVEPGCKQDYMLVFESAQGEKKSQWVEILGGEWYSVGELIPGDKDTFQALRGKWIVELPEIDNTFTKAEHSWMKKVISTAVDTYRGSYERRAASVPRESVFYATINPNASNEYLKDFENRRYWPIKMGKLNLDLLRQNRDQYFAEAMVRLKADPDSSWIRDPEVIALAKKEQELRREQDPWVEILEMWTRDKTQFVAPEAYQALGLTPDRLQSRTRSRVYAALKSIGWEFNFGKYTWERRINWEALL